jgi:hypothetical protein
MRAQPPDGPDLGDGGSGRADSVPLAGQTRRRKRVNRYDGMLSIMRFGGRAKRSSEKALMKLFGRKRRKFLFFI